MMMFCDFRFGLNSVYFFQTPTSPVSPDLQDSTAPPSTTTVPFRQLINKNLQNQKLNLVIGVPPQHFDSLYSGLIKIGKVQAKQIATLQHV